jgi:hypothetical protein
MGPAATIQVAENIEGSVYIIIKRVTIKNTCVFKDFCIGINYTETALSS